MRATYVVVPVNKRALRVVPPRPDVKLEEGRNMESVWAVDEEKYLTLQNRRTGVVREPGGRVGNVLDANQRHLTVGRWLIDQSLGLRGVDRSVEQAGIDVVNAHRAMVRTADTAQKWAIASSDGIVDVEVLFRSLANNLNEFVLIFLSGWLHCVLSQGKRGKCQDADEEHGIVRCD